MTEQPGEISRRHALRLVLGQGGEVSRERDKLALELDQAAALEGAGRPAAAPQKQRDLPAGDTDPDPGSGAR